MSSGMAGPAPFPSTGVRAVIRPGPVGLDSPQAQPAGFILSNPEDSRYGAASPVQGAPMLQPRGERTVSARPSSLGMVKSQDAAPDTGAPAAGLAVRNRKIRGKEQWKNRTMRGWRSS